MKIQIVEKYATCFHNKLNSMKLHVERDEIVGELGLVYAKCLNSYRPDNETAASFSTYVVRAFKNMLFHWIPELKKDARILQYVDDVCKLEDPDHLRAESDVIAKDLITVICRNIRTLRGLVIFRETINPTERVCECANLFAKYHPGTCRSMMLGKSIALVYGFSYDSVRYHMEKNRHYAKKALTSV